MKQYFGYLLLAVLCFLSTYGLFACRTFKKAKSSADSTVSRNVVQQELWRAEDIEELVIETDDLSFAQPPSSLPAISGIVPFRQVSILEKIGLGGSANNKVEMGTPGKKNARARLTFRKISRQSSQQSSQLHEEKDVRTTHLDKVREPNANGLLSISLITIVVLVVAIILYKSKRPD